MRREIRVAATTGALLALLCVGPPAARAEDSVKGGVEEVGEAVKHDTKEAVEEAEDAAKRGTKATEHGVGEALDKTGEGIEHTGEKLDEHGK